MFNRNRKFLEKHSEDKIEYVLWKNAHHVHQTDIGFIHGNLPQICKHSHMSQIFLDLNIEAISKFLKGETVEGTYGSKDLGRKFIPEKFYSEDNFTFWMITQLMLSSTSIYFWSLSKILIKELNWKHQNRMIRRCINNYRYLTCFDKPVTSLAINSIV